MPYYATVSNVETYTSSNTKESQGIIDGEKVDLFPDLGSISNIK